MPKAIIVCAVLAQYRVGSLENFLHAFVVSKFAQYRVGSQKKQKFEEVDFYGLIAYPQEAFSLSI